MKTVTGVSVQQKNKSRSNIYLDGSYFCSLDNLLVLKYRLKVGMQIEEQFLADVQQENEFSLAFDQAVGYISRFKKTKKQVIDYLIKKGYLYPVAHKVVDKLCSYGYVDDLDFARSYVSQNSKSKGKLLLKYELKTKGVDEKSADNAINDVEDETPAAVELAKKYMRSKPTDEKNLAKCYRYIVGKGFSFEAASAAVKSVRKGEEDDY